MADPELETEPTLPPSKGKRKGARASLHVEGETAQATVDDVIAAAGGRRGGSAAAKPPQPMRFEKAIRDPNNKIIAKRLQPTVTLEGEPLGDEFHDLLPHDRLTLDEIKRDLTEARGGRKWHVKVEDPDGKIVAAETINVPGDPKLEPGFDEGAGGGGGMGSELGEEETLEEQLEKDPDIVRMRKDERMMELETRKLQRQAELDQARATAAAAKRALDAAQNPGQPGTNGNGHKSEDERMAKMIADANAPLREALAASNKALDDEKARNRERDQKADRKAELEAIVGPLQRMQETQGKTLEALLAKLNTPPPPPTGPSIDTLLAKFDSMKSDLKGDFTQQITAAMTGIKDGLQSKIETVANSVAMLSQNRNDPATNALIALATKGGPGGSAPADPFAVLERAMTAVKSLQTMTNQTTNNTPQDFPSYLVDRVTSLAPDVMEFIKEQQMNAQVVTKDVMEAKMKELGTKMWQGLDQTIKSEIRNIRVTPSVNTPTPAPASAAAAGPPPPSVKPTPAPTGVGTPPPPVSAAPGSPPPSPAPAPAPAANVPPTTAYPFGMTQEDFLQTKKRVGHVLKILYGEMRLGVQAFKWPEQAFAHLPKPIIDALVPAETDVQIKEIIEPFADAQMMQDIWTYLSDSHPQHEWYRKWLTDGINWIKDAAADQGSGEEGEPVVEEP